MNQPFASDAEFLAAACDYLRLRCRRIIAQRDANATGQHDWAARITREHKCDALLAKDDEARAKAVLDARLSAHRADTARQTLGLDRLTDDHRLSDDERLILLSAALPGISHRVAEGVFGSLVTGYGSLTVTEAISILDATDIIDWLRHRRLFHAEAPLRRAGLIILKPHDKDVTPDSFPASEVRLSMTAFAAITGEEKTATETDGGAASE